MLCVLSSEDSLLPAIVVRHYVCQRLLTWPGGDRDGKSTVYWCESVTVHWPPPRGSELSFS